MTLHLHRAERADRLVEVLGDLLLEPLPDPMSSEIVAVPTRGVERWITQQLSNVLGTEEGRSDGVCANVDFPFPGRLITAALGDATGLDPDGDVWRPERLVWPLLEVVDGSIDEPWMATLAGYLRSDVTAGGRRFGAARHIADLFDRYAVHRPAMIRRWLDGDDLDGHDNPLPPEAVWQAELWRRVRGAVDAPSLAERLAEGCARLGREPEVVDLPPRFSLFGLTRLPASHVDVLHALALHRDVHLFLLHPSAVLWEEVGRIDAPKGVVPRSEDPTAGLPDNPLLRSWGHDAREMQLVVAAAEHADVVDEHHPGEHAAVTLLQRIQADVHADRAPDTDRPVLDPHDRSIEVHSCHGDARQVEVLRDAILHLLDEDPSLEPRDVLVMCPDIETYAPLIHAVFGTGRGIDADEVDREVTESTVPDLRVRLADRSLRQTNPILAAVSDLLALSDARLTASQVLDLAGRDAVRRRFDFDDDDLERLEDWVATAGIRWGLDGAHRDEYELLGLETNTWDSGLDRILLGAATPEDELALVGGVLPLDDVGSGDLDLVGRFAEFVERLGTVVANFRAERSVAEWAMTITSAAGMLTSAGEYDEWQLIELRRLLDDVTAEATIDGRPAGDTLSVTEIRALLDDRLRGRPTRANFRTGHLTVCTLVPMRSVPHRVVCLLGLDDGVFPRRTATDGDDLLHRAPCVGDRDPRSEDRQLLLDALLAASDHLVVTYCGRDERTNTVRSPAVPVWELLDVADATCRVEDGDGGQGRVRDRIVTEHPLQPFDRRNYRAGALVHGRPWSFDPVNLAGARAASGERVAVAPFLGAPLPEHPQDVVQLDDLIRFLRHPVRAFLRQRLGLVLAREEDEIADEMSIELDGLEQWTVGQRMLEARLDGSDRATCRSAELARGALPPDVLGEEKVDQLLSTVDRVVRAVGEQCPDHTSRISVEADVLLPSGASVVGTISNVVGDTILDVTYSRVAAPHRLTAWVRLLLLTATDPRVAYRAVTIGRGDRGKIRVATAGQLPGDDGERLKTALELLDDVCLMFRRGLCEPLPVYCRTSAAYAQAVAAGRSPLAAARREWDSTGKKWDLEDRDLEHRLVLGEKVKVEDLLASDPRSDESGGGRPSDEPSRFGRYARRLWDPILAHEEVQQS